MRSNYRLMPLMALLSACSLMPDYELPSLPVSALWPESAASAEAAPSEATSEQAAPVEWKEFFRSETLQGYIAQALEHNRHLRVAVLNVEKAQAAYRITQADYFPAIDAKGSLNKSRTPDNATATGIGATKQTVYNANLAVAAWEIDLFGKIRSQNEAAIEAYLATQSARDAAQIALIAETANAYLQWLADEKLLNISTQTRITQEKSHALVEASYKRGIRSRLDLTQAESTVQAARASEEAYKRAVAQDKNALAVLIGAPSADALKTTETLDQLTVMEALPVGLPATVLLARPDIQEAEHRLKSENANIGAARAAFFPSINLTAALGYASTGFSSLFSGGSGGAWNFSPVISLPLFAGGANVAALDQAKASQQIAVANYEKAIQVAFREVADALVARETLDGQLKATQAQLAANQESYTLTDARYKAGIDSYTNVLTAQQNLFAVQQNAVAVERQKLSNLVTLYKTLGGGLH